MANFVGLASVVENGTRLQDVDTFSSFDLRVKDVVSVSDRFTMLIG